MSASLHPRVSISLVGVCVCVRELCDADVPVSATMCKSALICCNCAFGEMLAYCGVIVCDCRVVVSVLLPLSDSNH